VDEIADCRQAFSSSWRWEMSDYWPFCYRVVTDAVVRTPLSMTVLSYSGKDGDGQQNFSECRDILLDHSADPTIGVDKNAVWHACGNNMVRALPFPDQCLRRITPS